MTMARVTGTTRLMMMNTRLYNRVLRSSIAKVLLVKKKVKFLNPAHLLANRLPKKPMPGCRR